MPVKFHEKVQSHGGLVDDDGSDGVATRPGKLSAVGMAAATVFVGSVEPVPVRSTLPVGSTERLEDAGVKVPVLDPPAHRVVMFADGKASPKRKMSPLNMTLTDSTDKVCPMKVPGIVDGAWSTVELLHPAGRLTPEPVVPNVMKNVRKLTMKENTLSMVGSL